LPNAGRRCFRLAFPRQRVIGLENHPDCPILGECAMMRALELDQEQRIQDPSVAEDAAGAS